jgi:hypothetical protein
MELTERPAPRRASARRLSLLMVIVCAAAFVGASAALGIGAQPFADGALFAAHIVLVGLAAVAAILEWRRERLGEAMTVPTILFAVVLTLVDVVTGMWYFAPALGVATLFAILALVHRFMVRDETRHRPRAGM